MKGLLQLLFDFWLVGASLAALVLIAYFRSKSRSNYSKITGSNNNVHQNTTTSE